MFLGFTVFSGMLAFQRELFHYRHGETLATMLELYRMSLFAVKSVYLH